MLLILFIINLLFFGFNLFINKLDYLNPSVLFSGVFLFSELFCLLNIRNFQIKFHYETVIVITLGLFLFSMMSFLFAKYNHENHRILKERKLKKIQIRDCYIIVLIILQVITILSFIYYLYKLTFFYNTNYAFEGTVSTSLPAMIKLYDTLTKFWTESFNKMNFPIPMIYRLLNPITYGCATVLIYIMVNNYLVDKKINKLYIVSLVLLCIHIYINGSRSPIFRIFTMIAFLYYTMGFKWKNIEGNLHNKKIIFFRRLTIIFVCFIGIMVASMLLLGRTFKASSINEYLFTYVGAPLVNLDNYLGDNLFGSHTWLFGAQSFKPLYNYLGKWTHNDALLNYEDIKVFAFSNNGIEIGNVYTTFYPWIYDFGVFGVLLIIPLAFYYLKIYNSLLFDNVKVYNGFSIKLFLYAYLFNDLVMLIFSNRFYETLLDPAFIKLMVFGLACFIFFSKFDIKKVGDTIRKLSI